MFYAAYRWSLRPSAHRWSPLRTLGQASLAVYWIHIELVYGRAFHDWSRALEIREAALHLSWFIPAMLLLALGVRRWRSAWTYVAETAADWASSRQSQGVRQEL